MDWTAFWTGFAAFYEQWNKLFTVVLIVAGALVARVVLVSTIKRVVLRVVAGAKNKQNVEDTQALMLSPLAAVRVVQRTRTIGAVLTNLVNVTLLVVAFMLVINVIDPNLLPSLTLLTAVIGAGLGFGAQNIVKDVLNGLFMVVEDQLGVGDVVDLGPATGVVEAVGIRITQVRDVNGTLWFVRNGEILRVGNMSQGWARVIIDLAVPYESDVDEVQERMLDTAVAMSTTPKWRSLVMERPEIWGLESVSAEALVIRLVVKTRSSAKDTVARELRMRLKNALDEMGVKLPALNSIVLSGFDGASSVGGARPPHTRPVATTLEGAPAAPQARATPPARRTAKPKPETSND
jgi:small-conductance mechanosensitive channel